MGISRDSRHKRRRTGGRMPIHKKKRKYEMARQPAMTKMGAKSIRLVRGRGGNYKYRALRLDHGNFCWASEQISRKAKVIDVVYNASNNELVRTKTLVKNCIVLVDATPFKTFFNQKYNIKLGKAAKEVEKVAEPVKTEEPKKDEKKKEEPKKEEPKVAQGRKLGKCGLKKIAASNKFIEEHFMGQFSTGRLLACISSRPGQVARADGYLLEGKELEFYQRKIEKKKKL